MNIPYQLRTQLDFQLVSPYNDIHGLDVKEWIASLSRKCTNARFHGFACRTCPSCAQKSAFVWSQRILDECMSSQLSVAFTLTYTNRMFYENSHDENGNYTCENVIWSDQYGEPRPYDVLNIRDIQLFKKRFATNLKRTLQKYGLPVYTSVRFFVKGEYGTKHHRPHWHGFVFVNAPQINDLALNQIVQLTILQSWNNALYLEISNEKGLEINKHDYPDMNHPYNKGKQFYDENNKPLRGLDSLHPLVAIWKCDDMESRKKCAQYCSKYVSKEISKAHPQVASGYRERQIASNYFGMSNIQQEIKEIKAKVHDIVGWFEQTFCPLAKDKNYQWEMDAKQDLEHYDFKQAYMHNRPQLEHLATLVSMVCLVKDGKPLPVPNYISRQLFDGYYVYSPQQQKLQDKLDFLDIYKKRVYKVWKTKKCVLISPSQERRNENMYLLWHKCQEWVLHYQSQQVYEKYFLDGSFYWEHRERDNQGMTALCLASLTAQRERMKQALNRYNAQLCERLNN